jgi:hypothetical protein
VTRFGERYELIRRIGAGGMGEVWLAHDERLASRPVAIKIMHTHMLPDSGDVARFEREARIAALMDHPNIVTVYTTGNCDGAPFMVMEYLRGHDLERAVPGGGAARVAAIGRDVCAALAYAHGKGVVHRDIKPGNLFLCDTGPVKVTDFGIAMAATGATLSAAGVLIGTFAYMPPEQWRGEPPAFSNDVWAAGCVLYRLISGRLPRVFPDAASYAAAATRGHPVPGLRGTGDAPGWLADAVMAMLDPDPARRPTAGDCVGLLSGTPSLVPAPARPPLARGTGWAGPGPVVGPAGQPPATVTMTRPVALPTASGRPRRPGRVIASIGGVLALVLAAALIGMRFHAAPQASGTAADGPSAPPTRSATTTAPATSAARPGSATASAAPRAAGTPSGSHAATPTATATAGATASAGPPLVPVPHVAGMTFSRARLVLTDDGFKVAGRHARLGQTVTSTSPSGRAPAGSVIVVVYGTGL